MTALGADIFSLIYDSYMRYQSAECWLQAYKQTSSNQWNGKFYWADFLSVETTRAGASIPPNANDANSPSPPFPSSFSFPSLLPFPSLPLSLPNTPFPFPSSLFPFLSLSSAAKRPPEIGKVSGGAL